MGNSQENREGREALKGTEKVMAPPVLEAVLDSLDTPVLVRDEEFRLVYCNDAVCRAAGLGRSELLGGTGEEFYTPDILSALRAADRGVLESGRSVTMEERALWQGALRNVVIRKSPHRDPETGQGFVVSVVLDVTDIRVTDKALRDSERKLRSILEQASVGVIVISRGRIMYANPVAVRASGYQADELRTADLESLVHPEDREMARGYLAARMTGGEVPAHYMLRLVHRDGRVRWAGVAGVNIEWEGARAGLYFLTDLSELKHTQDELRRSERTLRQVLDLVPHMIYARDAEGGSLLANETMARMHGSVVDPETGALPEDALGVFTRHELLAAVEHEALASQSPVLAPDLQFVDADGVERVLQCSVMPFTSDVHDGAVLGVCTDITSRHRTRKRLEGFNEVLLGFGSDPLCNINALVAFCGETLGGACALYSRVEGGIIEAVGSWSAPDDFEAVDDAEGHICTQVAGDAAGEPVVIRDLQNSPFALSDPNVGKYGLQTYMGIPVRAGLEHAGSLCVVYTQDHDPGDEDTWLLSVVAAAISVEERRQGAQETLQRRERAMRALVDASPDYVVFLDGENRIKAVNRRAAGYFGTEPEALLGREIMEFFQEGQLEQGRRFFRQVRESGEHVVFSERKGDEVYEHRIHPTGGECGGGMGEVAIFSRNVTEEKLAQRELMESESRFRAFFEQSAVGISLTDREGCYTLVNDKLCDILGYSREELLGMRFQEVTHPDDLRENMRLHHRMGSGDISDFTLEKRYICKDGSLVWVSITVTFVQDEAGRYKYNCTIVQDISLRKRIEKALLRRDAVLEAVGNAAEVLLQTTDWEEHIQGILGNLGTAAEASRAYVFRNDVDEQGRLCMSHIHEWTAPGVGSELSNAGLVSVPYLEAGLELLYDTLKEKRPHYALVRDLPEADREFLEPQGVLSVATVPIFVEGDWWGFLGFDDCAREREWLPAELEALMAAADILGNAVGRRRAEAALVESERRFRIIAETVEDVFWISTPNRAATLYLSPAYERHIGPREAIYKNSMSFFDKVHPEDRRALWEHYSDMPNGGGEVAYRVRRKDGTMAWVRERSFPVLDADGNVEWLAGIATDITTAREAEEGVRRSLREKELLLQEVHHRVKNNLQIISSLLDMAGRRIKDPDALDVMRDIQSKIHSMAMIHLQLYGYERFDSIDIADYARVLTWQLLQMYNASNVTPDFDLSETFLPLSKAIPCGLALSETLSNVFKHAYPDGSKGVLKLHVGPGGDGNVVLRIRDDGVGMPEGLTEKDYGSVGLKLVGNIVRFQLGGELTVEPGKGTTISIRFPSDDQGETA